MRLSTVGGEWIGPKGQLRSISATHLPGRPAVGPAWTSLRYIEPAGRREGSCGNSYVQRSPLKMQEYYYTDQSTVSEHPSLDSYLLVGSATLPVSNLLVGSRAPAPASAGRSITAPAARGVSSHLRGPLHDVLWSLPHDLAFYGIYKVAIRIDSTLVPFLFLSSRL
jgi:hypothetical protein